MAQYKTNVGHVILGLLNGIKHTPKTIAPILNINPEELENIISGELGLTSDIEAKLCSIIGINQRDFYPAEAQHLFPVIDDTNDGVVIFRAQDTLKSRRTLTRGPANTPYYVYADTAMTNISTFRPEWIKQLYVHDGENADELPDWAFNKGHFEHQVTYFIGPVNFYWIGKEGERRVCQMDTGDTNYIVPFVPHSFTTRREGEGLILAVTYGGAISNNEFRSKIEALSTEEYLEDTNGKLQDLLIADKNILGGVNILKYPNSCGSEISLVYSVCQPYTKTREVFLSYGDCIAERVPSDRWGYNIGDSDIIFEWSGGNVCRICRLNPGDSFFIKPGTLHAFKRIAGFHQNLKLLIIDIRPQLGDPYVELALIKKYAGEAGLKRVHTETTRWF